MKRFAVMLRPYMRMCVCHIHNQSLTNVTVYIQFTCIFTFTFMSKLLITLIPFMLQS